jgi:predicted HAD superfamily Cof-like phosphohydrolase
MNYEDVKMLYRNKQLPIGAYPCLLNKTQAALRVVYMLEELAEFNQATSEGSLVKSADALVDLAYFALGTAAMMGLPWEDLWRAVHSANLAKVPGTDKYGAAGLIKPEGWGSPRDAIDKILVAAFEKA